MTTTKFTFWAQALDNSSLDHIEMRGEELLPVDSKRRERAVSLMSSVMKSGTRVFQNMGVQLTANDQQFVIEVPSAQRDQAGRIAPIVCYGEYNSAAGAALGVSVVAGLEAFRKRIGRNIERDDLELARDSTVGDALGASVVAGLEDFAKRVGRSFQREHLELVSKSLAVLKQTYMTRKLVRLAAQADCPIW